MAARRLLIVMVLLLIASTIAAALAPPVEQPGRTEGATTGRTGTERTEESGEEPPAARELQRTVRIGAERAPRISLRTGDELALTVPAPPEGFAMVSIANTGLSSPAVREAPARLIFLARRPGEYPVVVQEGGRRVATIVVRRRARS